MSSLETVIAQYRPTIDAALLEALSQNSTAPIYGMLRYFMGFADENGRACVEGGGKRVRSTLLTLAADACGGAVSAIHLAVAVELFHNFSLIHDDIEDGDELRRGRKTVWKVWGINHAINAGDLQSLLANDYLLRAAAKDANGAQAAALLMRHFIEVAEGQYLDFILTEQLLSDPEVTEGAYIEMTRKKTSVLLGAAAAAGGVAAGCSKETEALLYQYGENLGLAYQIADDMASVWTPQEKTGKAAFGDLYERKKTLPVLIACAASVNRERLDELFALNRRLSGGEVAEVVSLINATDAYATCKERSSVYAEQARAAARSLPVSKEHIEALVSIVDGFVSFPRS